MATGTKAENEKVASIDKMELDERFKFWEIEFNRCVKCLGCRNICPMCFCNECTLEEANLIDTGEVPLPILLSIWLGPSIWWVAVLTVDCVKRPAQQIFL